MTLIPGKQLAGALFLGAFSVVAMADGESVDVTRDVEADGYVSVSVVRGTVRFRGWDKPQVRVQGTLDEQTREFIFEVDGRDTRIEVRIEESSSWFGSTRESDLTISLPAGSELDFSGVSVDVDARDLGSDIEIGVVSGDLYLQGGAGRVDLQTVSGDIEVIGSEGRIDIVTVSGDVETRGLDGDVEYSSVSGNITVREGGDEISIGSVSGDIDVESELLNAASGHSVSGDIELRAGLDDDGRLEFETVSGSIRLLFTGEPSARFDLETGSGSIRNELSDDEPSTSRWGNNESLNFTVGQGDGSVVLATHSGDITVSEK